MKPNLIPLEQHVLHMMAAGHVPTCSSNNPIPGESIQKMADLGLIHLFTMIHDDAVSGLTPKGKHVMSLSTAPLNASVDSRSRTCHLLLKLGGVTGHFSFTPSLAIFVAST